MDIEALVKKHAGTMWLHETPIRAALTEQAEHYQQRIRQLEAERVPEGWMRDRAQVDSLITYLEGVAYQSNTYGVTECVNQAAAMSVDVLRMVLLPMLAAAPAQEKV